MEATKTYIHIKCDERDAFSCTQNHDVCIEELGEGGVVDKDKKN